MSDSDENPALSETISHLRRTPDLDSRFRLRGTDSVVVVGWLRGIDRYLTGSQRRKGDEYLQDLLGTAGEFLEAERERLVAAWATLTSSDAWGRLPRSARDMCDLLYAIAGSRHPYGGPNVVLAHRIAVACMEHRTGHRYKNIATITQTVRPALEKTGMISVTVGCGWSGGKPRSSVYHLLAENELALNAGTQKGLVHFESVIRAGLPYPQWTPEDDFVFTVIRGQRREERARWKQGGGTPQPEVPDLGYLIDGWPPHTDFDETAYQAYQEDEDEQEPGAGSG